MKIPFLHMPISHRPKWPIFAIPSIVGIIFYLAPIYYQGAITIPIALLVKGLQAQFNEQFPAVVTFIICFAAIPPLVALFFRPNLKIDNKLLKCILCPSWQNFVVRQLAAVLVVMVYFGFGPSIICSDATGGMVLDNILPVVLLAFIVGGLLLPLLLEFGLPELCGALGNRIMRPIFMLPGHSSVNCLASWVGENCVGIMIADQLYEKCHYTMREAAVISTTFPIVSITYCVVVITQVGLVHLFVPFYFTVCTAGLVTALVVPRLPPLAGKPNTYIDDTEPVAQESVKLDQNAWRYAMEQAVRKTDELTSFRKMFADSISKTLTMVVIVLPITAIIATAAILLAEYTIIFQYVGKPFVPLLVLLQIPEAANASECMVIGFTDMILPAVLASSIESDLTRFFIAVMSVVQLIYLSEPGAQLVASKIKVNILEMFVIFLLRTLVSMPVAALMAHLVF